MPQPVILAPGVGGGYAPGINEQIERQYNRVMAAAADLDYDPADVQAGQTMEDFKMVQIMARRGDEWLYVVQVSVYEDLSLAAESFQLIYDKAQERATLDGGEAVGLSRLEIPDPDSGELQLWHMASALEGNAVILCTEEGDAENALESMKTLLSH